MKREKLINLKFNVTKLSIEKEKEKLSKEVLLEKEIVPKAPVPTTHILIIFSHTRDAITFPFSSSCLSVHFLPSADLRGAVSLGSHISRRDEEAERRKSGRPIHQNCVSVAISTLPTAQHRVPLLATTPLDPGASMLPGFHRTFLAYFAREEKIRLSAGGRCLLLLLLCHLPLD